MLKEVILGPGIVVQAFNPSIKKAEAGGSRWAPGQPGLVPYN